MHQQSVILLVVGLAVACSGLDLSHASKRSTELDPRILGFIGDLYAQVIYPPLNHVVTNMALLGAQVLAGISQTGIPAPGGRTLHPSEEELRGFFSGLWNDALKPPLADALSNVALMAAQVLAGVGMNGVNLGIGKRDLTEAEMRGFLDALNQAVNDVYTNVIQKPLESALSGGALMLAQMLAGIGVNGVNLGIGKRDLTEAEMRGFLDALNQAVNDVYTNVIQKPLESALSGGALMLAQMLAGVGVNGVNLGIGKRDLTEAEMRGFLDALNQAVNDVYANVIQKPLENALAGGALMLAQMLAGVGVNGVNLGIGKRDLSEAEMRGFLDALNQAVNDVYANVIQKPLENALAGGALMLAQMLAGVGVNGVNLGIGKRDLTEAEMRGFLDALNQAVNDVYANVIQKPLENALAGGALMLAQMLAGVGVNGVNLGIGKRDMTEAEMRGFFDNLWNDALKPPLENALSGVALLAAQVLAGIGVNGVNLGIGKRDLTEAEMRGFLDALNQAVNDVYANVIQKPLENALAGGALMLAQMLAGVGVNGVNLGIGKREAIDLAGREEELRGIFTTVGGTVLNGLAGVWNNVLQVPLENFVQNSAMTAAGWLANLSSTVGKRSAEARGPVISTLVDHASGLFADQVKPLLENAINNAALQLAGVLANFSQNGFGRR